MLGNGSLEVVEDDESTELVESFELAEDSEEEEPVGSSDELFDEHDSELESLDPVEGEAERDASDELPSLDSVADEDDTSSKVELLLGEFENDPLVELPERLLDDSLEPESFEELPEHS